MEPIRDKRICRLTSPHWGTGFSLSRAKTNVRLSLVLAEGQTALFLSSKKNDGFQSSTSSSCWQQREKKESSAPFKQKVSLRYCFARVFTREALPLVCVSRNSRPCYQLEKKKVQSRLDWPKANHQAPFVTTANDKTTLLLEKMGDNKDDLDQQIEIFKIKKLIKNLEAARGNGTSMISLIIPPGDQISRVNKMLSDEYGTASNIKSRVNRLSVLSAITSTQQRLKLFNKCPKNGMWRMDEKRESGRYCCAFPSRILHSLTHALIHCSPNRARHLLWNSHYRRWKRTKGQYWFWTFQTDQYFIVSLWQQVPHWGLAGTLDGRWSLWLYCHGW